MFDVVVKPVAVADAVKGKSGGRWNELGQVCMGQSNLPLISLARKEPNAFAANWER
jgi:hypothetical protein